METSEILCAIRSAGSDSKLLPLAVENIELWLEGGWLPGWAVGSIGDLVEQEAWDELNDRFYQNLVFGTGGMRGRTIGNVIAKSEAGALSDKGSPEYPAVGTAFLNDFNVIRATVGLYRYCERFLKKEQRYETPKLVIAHDVRHFSRHFCELAASTWNICGGKAMIFGGPRSTPHLSFAVRRLQATTGIVITASHNPPHDNGYKVYFDDGAQVVSPHAESIVEEIGTIQWDTLAPFFEKDLEGVVELPASLDDEYLDALEDNVLDGDLLRKASPKVVFTPIHGTGGVMSVPLMKRFGVDVVDVDEQAVMDPRFPTVKSPNPENAEALAMGIEKANACGADIVLATDPDCDRMGVAVRNKAGEMELLTGNMIGSLLAEFRISKLKELGHLPKEGSSSAVLIKTFVTTPLSDAIAKGHGLKLINTLTGFKWIGAKLALYERTLKDALLADDGIGIDYDGTSTVKRRELLLDKSTYFVFGYEESYGYLASDRVRDKDGNAAAILFCELAAYLKEQGKTLTEYLDELYLKYGYYSEGILNIYYEGAAGAAKIKNILKSYRENPPQKIGDYGVTEFKDFGVDKFSDADGQEIPSQDFYFLTLDNGYSFAVRGSGTEPKIKFYLFGRENVSDAGALAAVKEQTIVTLDGIKAALEADARTRAG